MTLKGEGPPYSQIRLNWSKIHYTTNPGLHELLSNYSEVLQFQEDLGSFEGYEANIKVDPNATPQFCKAQTVPYAMHGKVEAELDRLVAEGTLKPVEYSDWVAPIVAVVKSDRKSVRICRDFRVIINPVSQLHRYPVPKIEDIILFATLEGGRYLQNWIKPGLPATEYGAESQKYLVINMLKGLFHYTNLHSAYLQPQEFSRKQ